MPKKSNPPYKGLPVPEYLSPEVAPDGRVTIRYFHPTAKRVWFESDWNNWAPTPMRAGKSEIWSATTAALKPDLYEYALFADGTRVIDYWNPASKNRFTSFVEVPGGKMHEVRPVPSGSVHVHWYDSDVTGERRRMHVYTPPGYETGAKKYPVLYLLHGAGDDDDGWIRTGRMNVIMDNLIAKKRAAPMVVAMPYGHVFGTNWKENREKRIRAFHDDFHQHVIPEIERRYRVRCDRGHRAMAGLSMGGGQTISAGLTHPKMFEAFGIFSSGLWPEITPIFEKALPALAANQPRVLWVGIGRRDFLYQHCELLRGYLKKAKVKFTYREDDTAHSWGAWRDYLERFVPLIFRE